MYDFLCRNAEKWMDKPALNYFSKLVSYRNMINEIDKCADALISAGITRGDRVSVCLPNIPQAVYLFYAINKIGAVANMIHPLSSENEIVYALNLSESKMIIALDISEKKINAFAEKTMFKSIVYVSVSESMPWYLKMLYSLKQKKPELSGRSVPWKEFTGKTSGRSSSAHGKGDECAVILYSGGTTGKPKGIELTNLNFNALALQSTDAC